MESALLSGVDKAAVLVLSLPEEDAKALLEHMQADEIEQVLTAVARIDDVSVEVQAEVIAEFRSRVTKSGAAPASGREHAAARAVPSQGFATDGADRCLASAVNRAWHRACSRRRAATKAGGRMELIHNGRAERIESARLARVGDVLAACTEPGDHVLLSLRLDGCEIEEAERAEIARLSTDAEGKLEVESRPRRAVARDGLESAAAYAGEVAGAFGRVAELLREGQLERAQALFGACLDAVVVLLAAVRRAADALGPVAAPLAAFEPALERGVAAMEAHFAATDWVGLADCVEFEVAAAIANWQEPLGAVRRAAEEEQ